MSPFNVEEDDYVITPYDLDPSNVMMRAGYLAGLASRADPGDRIWLLRASRSLRALAGEKPKP